jgi:hypothetical protein
MKRLSALLALSALVPIAAGAQDAPPPPLAGKRAEFEATHAKFEQLRLKIRAQVLAVLTPADRTLLAQIVGSLAVADVPDVDGAAHRLDATLSTSQKAAILQAIEAGREEMRKAMPPPPAGFSPPPGLRRTQAFMHRRTPDAGAELLEVSVQFREPHRGPWMREGKHDRP